MKAETQLQIIELLAKDFLISDIFKRNEEIRIKFNSLKTAGIKVCDAIDRLSDEYFLSNKHIQRIVYEKHKNIAPNSILKK